METDTLIEKFVRSEEALNRLGDDIKQLLFTRVQELRESKDYLNTLIMEKEAVDAQLHEQEARITSNQKEINNLTNLKKEFALKQINLTKEAQEKELQIENLSNESNYIKEETSRAYSDLEILKTDIKNKREKISEIMKSNQDLEVKLSTEQSLKNAEIKKFEERIQILETSNPVISFLLKESAEDIPEVEILATIMKLNKTNINQLKKELEGILSPVIISRTLGRMVEKNILVYDESEDIIEIK